MSLLILNSTEKGAALAQKIFDRQFSTDKNLNTEYDERRKRLMFIDILYNLECLENAIRLDADMIFIDYARWIFRLLASRMNDIPIERVKEHMVEHYKILIEILDEEFPPEEAKKAEKHLNNAIRVTSEEVEFPLDTIKAFATVKYADINKRYLQSMLKGDKKEADKVIQAAISSGVELKDIYIEVFQQVMYEVGNLWHQNKLTVDKEHYCTAVTQGIMMQLYPILFRTQRVNHMILACCVGDELHEMGIRMLCDIFELYGWDSVYIGSSVPKEGIIHAIGENKPDLLALSVTMPHHLGVCQEIIKEIRNNHNFDNVKIAVGGRAFQLVPNLWKEWGADVTTNTGVDLAEWAKLKF